MRVGDFGVEVVAHGGGRVRELESGHVLARPGQVYRLRLRNFGPLRCVADVRIDGHAVTAGGLVLDPWSATELERSVDAGEDGRFTVVAEGDESVFGPDGGRDDPRLGVIESRFRRELPRHERDAGPTIPSRPEEVIPAPTRPLPDVPTLPTRFPGAPPEWAPPLNRAGSRDEIVSMASRSYRSPAAAPVPTRVATPSDAIERAAGTGLTGHSDQRFVPIHLGPLETEATVITLRMVIGTEEAIAEDAPRPLPGRQDAPERPAPMP